MGSPLQISPVGGDSIAVSGNGEAIPGGNDARNYVAFLRSPGFACGGTVIGYSQVVRYDQKFRSPAVYSPDPCDSKKDVTYPDATTFLAAGFNYSPEIDFVTYQGKIFNLVSTPELAPPPQLPSSLATDNFVTEGACYGDSDSSLAGTSLQETITAFLQYSPAPGTHSISLDLTTWGIDPGTQAPVPCQPAVTCDWNGSAGPLQSTYSSSSTGTSYSLPGLSLTVNPQDPALPPGQLTGSMQVVLDKVKYGYSQLTCTWVGP
jgi:hypothetical protein